LNGCIMKNITMIFFVWTFLAGCSALAPKPYRTQGELIVNLEIENRSSKVVKIGGALIDEPFQDHYWKYNDIIVDWLKRADYEQDVATKLSRKVFEFRKVDFKGARNLFGKSVGTPVIGIRLRGECEQVWLVYFDSKQMAQYVVYDPERSRYSKANANSDERVPVIGTISEIVVPKEVISDQYRMVIDLKIAWNGQNTCAIPRTEVNPMRHSCFANKVGSIECP